MSAVLCEMKNLKVEILSRSAYFPTYVHWPIVMGASLGSLRFLSFEPFESRPSSEDLIR